MAFPNDLSDVAVFKIHPAIGCARVANNDDFYEFFNQEEKRKAGRPQSPTYMTLRDGRHCIMRQAVRFRIFAYRANGGELGELTAEIMGRLGVSATWTASVANRKLNVWSHGATPVVAAQASATTGQTKRLEGDNPWRPGKVWLGDITGDGLFIPPKGGVYRKTPDTMIPPFGSHRSDNGVLDTTSDGSIHVSLTGTANLPVIPACVVVAPQDHSPDVNPEHINNSRNVDFVKATRQLLNIPENATLVGVGYGMDIAMMKTMNAEYSPGMEICLDGDVALPDPAGAFFPRGQSHIDRNEIRPSYEFTKQGQLTAGLCSAWQTDLNACLDYWTSTYPNEVAFSQPPETRILSRKRFASDGPQERNPEWLNAHIDMMDVGRDVENDPTFVHGTERTANDDVGDDPVPPFPVDPQ
jgi:hypothetical protein